MSQNASATASGQASAHAANTAFLAYARTTWDIVQLGTITNQPTPGPAAIVSWAPNTPPVAPAWATEAIITATVPITVTVAAGVTIYISPFYPYCMFAHNLVLGGAPPFATPISGTPFYLDEVTSWQNYDLTTEPYAPQMGTVSGLGDVIHANSDLGLSADIFSFGNSNLKPGQTYTNSGTGSATLAGTVAFTYRIRLKRRRRGMWGCIPLGDPENRPILNMYLNAIVGNFPENNSIQQRTGTATTAVITSAGTVNVYLTWKALQLDIVPPGVGAIPQPTVGLGLSIDTNNGLAISNSGQIVQVPKRSAMVYEKMFHFLTNNYVGIQADYWALWTTGQQQSARWEFDSSQNNFQDYFVRTHDQYQRWFPIGVYISDLIGGDIPELPAETAYKALMSPDVGYANLVGVAPTPAMYNAIRVPSATSITAGTCYVRSYDFGLVTVPY